MAQRHNHYEAAFEDYVRSRGWPYIPVDEQKKAIFSGARVKSFDFLVYRPGKTAWLADIKGRKFPYEGVSGKRYWENWVTELDLEGLHQWDQVFGDGFEPGFVFAYWLIGPDSQAAGLESHFFRQRYYAFAWISAQKYANHARARSSSWGTVSMPTRDFKKMIQPLQEA